ncbi:uncharacterized protein DSM5745_07148 [Aspergillus mulundensis]|uniref:Uncharacterized protein n=1 Tax=Aspergillus mulundensis TaxID=1810919 RepID=A0A3D8RKL1_9EURO|nr:hypothetical protein DSM5745_07148 [Aspergillus mulundensis]RDW74486.1 hypothetical protein DSM5745_07148 [Aspergillus mulundensis]
MVGRRSPGPTGTLYSDLRSHVPSQRRERAFLLGLGSPPCFTRGVSDSHTLPMTNLLGYHTQPEMFAQETGKAAPYGDLLVTAASNSHGADEVRGRNFIQDQLNDILGKDLHWIPAKNATPPRTRVAV